MRFGKVRIVSMSSKHKSLFVNSKTIFGMNSLQRFDTALHLRNKVDGMRLAVGKSYLNGRKEGRKEGNGENRTGRWKIQRYRRQGASQPRAPSHSSSVNQ